jgi:hypothetical protein
MAILEAGLNVAATGLATAATHIALVDETGTELTGGTPAYARQAVTWTTASAGLIRPDDDLEFDVPASTTVAGWRAFSALTNGTNYGGEDVTDEVYSGQGTYTLAADETAFDFDAA